MEKKDKEVGLDSHLLKKDNRRFIRSRYVAECRYEKGGAACRRHSQLTGSQPAILSITITVIAALLLQ